MLHSVCFNWWFRLLMQKNGSWKVLVLGWCGARGQERYWEMQGKLLARSVEQVPPQDCQPSIEVTSDAFVSTCIEMHAVFLADLQQEPRPCLELPGEEGSVLCSLEREISPDLGGINYFVFWTLAFWQIYLNYRLTVSVGTEEAISMNRSLIY